MGSGESSCPLPRSAPVVRPLNSPFSSEPRVGACCLASMDSTARRGECHRHPPSPHSACIDANPTMKMEAILAKTVSGRIASVLILYQVDFWFLRPRIAQKPEVYLVLLHLEALSSPAPRPFPGKVEKRRGGLRDRRRALGAPAGLRLPPFFSSPQKSTGKDRGKGPTSKTAKSGIW